MDKVYVIGVCGPSCSGKTKTVDEIVSSLPSDVTILSQDSYYLTGSEDTNYDVPEAIDFDLMADHLKQLIEGKGVKAPIYDFSTHSRVLETDLKLPSKIVILEGILIFTQKELRDLIDLKVYISAYNELAFARRLKRDVESRGRTIEEVTERYFKDVLPSSKIHVEPTECYADIVLKNNIQNQFLGLKLLIDHISVKLSK